MNKLPASLHRRLSQRLISLEENPRPRGSRKLTSMEEYRLRVGAYRILYTIDDTNW
jgi:mRNA interferase RelE/StbE